MDSPPDEREDRVAELEKELEDATLARFVEERLRTPPEKLLSVEELAERAGRGHVLTDR